MWFVHHLVIVTVLICEASAKNFCSEDNEEYYYCKYKGETYSQLCPGVTKTCTDIGERICVCQKGYFRRIFWARCVPYRECVVPNPWNLHVDPIEEPVEDHRGDQPTTEATPQNNDEESPSASATNDELFSCVWCPALRTLDTTSESAQMSNDGSVNSRSLVQTGLEAVPRSVRQRVKARTDFFEVHETFTPWEEVRLSVSVVHRERRTPTLQLHPFSSRSLPSGAQTEYEVLHANGDCIIIGKYPQRGMTADCFFWTTKSKARGSHFECDFIWEYYCHFPTDVPFDGRECQ
ncbi:uncharacterized protein LOC142564731 [Dermacentor variabilis]|uniref:uncharacterized protein LOC142564731 n=1 Tax=Dermacentor variabilis TaxID=34621 RepID=UPI003F5C76F2